MIDSSLGHLLTLLLLFRNNFRLTFNIFQDLVTNIVRQSHKVELKLLARGKPLALINHNLHHTMALDFTHFWNPFLDESRLISCELLIDNRIRCWGSSTML